MELKFRAWDKKLKKMIVTGFHVFGEYTLFGLIHQYCFDTKGEGDSLQRLNDIEVTQYIGRSDKNGNELYVNDIIQYYNRKGVVFYGLAECAYCLFTESDNTYVQLNKYVMAQVIKLGNIYENPELLSK